MVQCMLPQVILKLYSNAGQHQFVHSYSNCYLCNNKIYAIILLHNDWMVKPSVLLKDDCLQIITCKWHDGGHNKLTLFAPQSPYGHIFNAEGSDQLSPCVRRHRVSKQMKVHQYCTKHGIYQVHSGYYGVSAL